jgi:hypothetical protein
VLPGFGGACVVRVLVVYSAEFAQYVGAMDLVYRMMNIAQTINAICGTQRSSL